MPIRHEDDQTEELTLFEAAVVVGALLLPLVMLCIGVTIHYLSAGADARDAEIERKDRELKDLLRAAIDREQVLTAILNTVDVGLTAVELTPDGHSTNPPSRFTEPALVIGNQRRVGLLELEGEQAVKAILKTDSAAELVAPLMDNKTLLTLALMLLVLVVGTALDFTPTVLIMTPVLMPVLKQAGIDPVYFGVLFIMNNAIGLVTPPVGTVLNVVCGVARIPMSGAIRGVWPFMVAQAIVMLLLVLVPQIVMWPLQWMTR